MNEKKLPAPLPEGIAGPNTGSSKSLKILEVSKERFLHYGVAKTRMREIAGDLGISVSNLYLYFTNKNELVLAIAQECQAEQEHRLQIILETPNMTPQEKLKAFLIQKYCFLQDFSKSGPHAKELIAYLIQEFPQRLEEWEKRFEDSVAGILHLAEGKDILKNPDIRENARLIRLATAYFYLPIYVELPKPQNEADFRQLIDWLTDSIFSVQ